MREAFRSKSEALDYIDFGIERGQFQPCGNLVVIDSLNILSGRQHHPHCRANSLREHEVSYRRTESHCPDGCRFFVPKQVAEREDAKQRNRQKLKRLGATVWHGITRAVAAPFVYFRSLPALVQSLVIILLILWMLPKSKSTIIEILKAIGGK
jgi:hypothetical protein